MPSSDIKFTQNFLHDAALVQRLVNKADLPRGGMVLEIGPGKGIITTALAKAVGDTGKVIAVELDKKLAAQAEQRFESSALIEVVRGDILQFPLDSLGSDYSVFSNIPFNITSALLEHLLNPSDGPQSAHLILQTDALVGQNKFGGKTETFKSLLIRPIYDYHITHHFARSDYSPQPSVETALFRFDRCASTVAATTYAQYKDFLAFASKDRVGEGKWLKLFSKKQINSLGKNGALIAGRGLKSQSFDAIWQAYRYFAQNNAAKHSAINDAFAALRNEQHAKDQKNRAGGHHRTKRRSNHNRRQR